MRQIDLHDMKPKRFVKKLSFMREQKNQPIGKSQFVFF